MPGGPDPIPGVTGSSTLDFGALTPIPLEFVGASGDNVSMLGGFEGPPGPGGFTYQLDATFSHNGAAKSTADAANFTFPFPFTPAGSLWGFSVRGKKGPSFGILQIALASVESPNPNRSGVNDDGTFNDQEGDMTFVDVPDAFVNCYNATAASEDWIIRNAPFRLNGAEGDPLTTFSGSDAYTGFDLMNGGPGWYMVRLYTDGKHASSSGYAIQISSLVIARVNG